MKKSNMKLKKKIMFDFVYMWFCVFFKIRFICYIDDFMIYIFYIKKGNFCMISIV